MPWQLCPREKPGTQCVGGWVGPRAGLDGCGKSRPHRDSIPGPSSRGQMIQNHISVYHGTYCYDAFAHSHVYISRLLLKQDNACVIQHRGAFVQPILQWKSSITYSECVFVALGIVHAMHMCHICVLFTSKYFSTLTHKHHSRKKKFLNIKCFLFLQLLSEAFLIPRRSERSMTNNVYW
jgi:hypothetical protein